jgi:large subunit ribosomal protein L31
MAPAALSCRLRGTDRATHTRESRGNVKAEIHPEYVVSQVTCTCGNEFTTRSTNPEIRVEICAECHPFYTGKQKIVDTGGRIERFNKKRQQAK